jgi:hypothetical protein
MDVPGLAKRTGAIVYGSSNTCRICQTQGVPQSQTQEICSGQILDLNGHKVEVLPGYHGPTPLDFVLNRPLNKKLHSPLRLLDYRKDDCFGFLIETRGKRYLFGIEPRKADCWFFYPMYTRVDDLVALGERCPKILVPIHWDDMFLPLEKGIRPGWELPTLKPPFLHRANLERWVEELHNRLPGVEIQVPEGVC